MPARSLSHVLKDLQKTLHDCRCFAADGYCWSQPGEFPHIARGRRDSIAELAFLRGFASFESFLEETFVLYLMGRKPQRGRVPHRFVFPPDRRSANDWLVPEGRSYAAWDAVSVRQRAERFFRKGRPFAPALRGSQASLDETKIIRNAIAHHSVKAQQPLQNLVRNKIGIMPRNLSVGGFLYTIVPKETPPLSFLEFYLDRVEKVALQIVPS